MRHTKRFLFSLFALPIAALALAQAGPGTAPPDAAGLEHYEKKIRPLFAEQCYSCHGAKQQMSGLRLDAASGIKKGGNRGPLLGSSAAGRPEESLLAKAVRYGDVHLRMPPRAKLADDNIAAIVAWVKMGAPMPPDRVQKADRNTQGAAASRQSTAAAADWKQREAHWAYQPVRRPLTRRNSHSKRTASHPIDTFLLAEMAKRGLSPASPADQRTLIRRLTFDLIGLPPTRAEVSAFLADKSPDAYEKVVDRLLASPHYGERWGRHWLDLVRYAETLGHEFDFELPNAWRYRDYVIRALNADVPFDQFAMEHVAGDLLPTPRRNAADGSNESIVGTAFWWMAEGKHSPVDVRQEQADRMDNQIDVFGKAFLGQTLACARCHDHKFDPIKQRDYYALAGYLRSSRYQQAHLDGPDRVSAKAQSLDRMRTGARETVLEALSKSTQRIGMDRLLAAVPSNIGPDHPLYAFARLSKPEGTSVTFAERAAALRAELHQKDMEARREAAKSVLFEDFQAADFGDWHATGDAFGAGPTRVAEQKFDGGRAPADGKRDETIAANPQSAIRRPQFETVPPGLAHSGLNSDRLEGVLRSKSFTIDHRYILIRASGRDSRIHVVLDGFQLIRDPIYGPCRLELNDDKLAWRVLDMSLWKGRHAYIELIDSTVPTLTHGQDGGPGRLSRGHIAVDEIRISDSPVPPPPPVDPANLAVLEPMPPDSLEAFAGRYADLIIRADCSIGDEGARDKRFHSLALCLGRMDVSAALPDTFAAIEASIPAPTVSPALVDGPGEDEDIFLRGNHKTPGKKAPRGIPPVCLGTKGTRKLEAAGLQPKNDGSGRLELARRLVSPANPLFARVIVNRIWQHHFGEGIVRSPDDFGRMGQRPTHPELLDWLAVGFSEGSYPSDGPKADHASRPYSLKGLHRLLVTSSAYRRSSVPGPSVAKIDPQNKLLSHMPVRRLEAEAIRDSILAVSGRLDAKMGGQGVLAHLTPFMEGRGRPGSGPLDGDGRRSIYIAVRRNFLMPMFLAFDYPVPFSCMGRRSVSNVPAQALALMNSPFVQQQAKLWADRLLNTNPGGRRSVDARPIDHGGRRSVDAAVPNRRSVDARPIDHGGRRSVDAAVPNHRSVDAKQEGARSVDASPRLGESDTASQRIREIYETAFSRPPTTTEESEALAFIGSGSTAAQDTARWADLCHVIFNVKEFIFVR